MPEQVPFTEEEKQWLQLIYQRRRRNLLSYCYLPLAFALLVFYLVGYRLFLVLEAVAWQLRGMKYGAGDATSFYNYVFGHSGLHLLVLLVLIPAAVTWLAYKYWAVPYREDALTGYKELMPYTITRKEAIPATDQYFVHITSPTDRPYELDYDTWRQYAGGDTIYLYRAVKSGYIFCENNNVRVKLIDLWHSVNTGEKWI